MYLVETHNTCNYTSDIEFIYSEIKKYYIFLFQNFFFTQSKKNETAILAFEFP